MQKCVGGGGGGEGAQCNVALTSYSPEGVLTGPSKMSTCEPSCSLDLIKVH